MYADAPAAYFRTVDHKIISIRFHAAWITFKLVRILWFWSCEGMVHGVPAAAFLILLQQWKIQHPQWLEHSGITQTELIGQMKTQFAQLLADLCCWTCHYAEHVTQLHVCCFGPFLQLLR